MYTGIKYCVNFLITNIKECPKYMGGGRSLKILEIFPGLNVLG